MKSRPDLLPRKHPLDDISYVSIRDDHVDARQRSHFRRLELAPHPSAPAIIARTTREATELVGDLVDIGYQLRIRVTVRIRGVQTIHFS